MKHLRLLATMLLVIVLCTSVTGNALASKLAEAPQPKDDNSKIAPKNAMQSISINHNLRRSDVLSMAKSLPHTAFSKTSRTTFEEQPNLHAPYAAGQMSNESILDALNALKMVRYLAGVPYANIRFGEQENQYSQHGATLLAASNQFTHTPTKPGNMDAEFFALAYKGCYDANLATSYYNAPTAIVDGFIGDRGANNIKAVGHRRWLLMPGASVYGIGQAGDRTSLHVMSNWPITTIANDYVAWPNGGDFPLQYFVGAETSVKAPEFPWSINLGALYTAPPSKSKLRITMTRKHDNRKWVFDSSTPSLAGTSNSGMHLDVESSGGGMPNTITFRPDLASLGVIRNGDTYNISVTGLSGPNISYEVRFFDMNRPAGYVEANNLTFNKTSAKLKAGKNLTLSASLLPSNSTSRQVIWSSTNSAVASVTQSGRILAKKKGTTTIVAMAADNTGVFARCNITVTGKAVALKKITADKTVVVENGSTKPIQLKFKPTNTTYKEVTYRSSNPEVASVNDDGVVTGRRLGKAIITITSVEGGKHTTCEASVVAPVESIIAPQSTVYIAKGDAAKLNTTTVTRDGSYTSLKYETSDKKIVAVDTTGLLRALKNGQATITIKADNGVKKKVTVVVGGSPIQSLTISGLPSNNTLKVGMHKLSANFRPSNAQGTIYFNSDNTNVIKIDASGQITALNPGTATITLIMGNKSVTVTLTVAG